MNILDIIVWLALAVAVFNGWRKGFIGKLFSLAGLVGGIWLALGYGARCGEALHMEGTTAAVAGPIVVFVAAAVAANLVGRLVSKACSTIGLGGLDTLLGIALALLQAVLLLGLAFKATDYFDPELIARSTREESKCYAPVMCVADKIFPSLGEYAREYLPRPEREEPAEKPETTEKLQNACAPRSEESSPVPRGAGTTCCTKGARSPAASAAASASKASARPIRSSWATRWSAPKAATESG